MREKRHNKFQRLIVPGLIFQSVVIAGGYGTGAELAEFFFPFGALGGLIAMCTVTFLFWAAVCAVTFEFARVFKTYDYRSLFKQLLGPFWFLFEICYLVLLLIVLAVVVAASGSNINEVFGLNRWIGVGIMAVGVIYLVVMGTGVIEKVLSFWSYVLYAVYLVFMIMSFIKFGESIVYQLGTVKEIGPGWALGGARYAFYNLGVIPLILFSTVDAKNRAEAIGSGLIAGAIGIIPAIMLFIVMIGQYPETATATVPVNVVFQHLNVRWLQIVFQIVLFGTLIETGSGFIKAVSDRLEGQFSKPENPRRWIRPVTALICVLLGVLVSTFGLTGLIAKGYGTITWGFFVLYVIPMLTWGVYKIVRHKKAR
ncbi:MAG: hypothetical protein LBO67_03645 [Spirochaetaceae bacterium]|nr:hypothetical protein [Spirochaetaceae bacterium]